MDICHGCGNPEVDPRDPPRYDVLSTAYSAETPNLFGPYCSWCFNYTETGIKLIEQSEAENDNLQLEGGLQESGEVPPENGA